jgi:hypothetical protein
MNATGRQRLHGRETLLALLVVALTFLNFGHSSVVAASGVQVTPGSWCGDPLLPGSQDHPSCHACRIGSGADLPPAPIRAEPVSFVATIVAYAAPDARVLLPVQAAPAQPRGPPGLI